MTVSLVTGANSGIGRATAARLAIEGHSVAAGMRDVDKATKLLDKAGDASDRIHPIALDVTDDDSVVGAFARVVEMLGPIDVLVNNAGVGMNSTTEDIDIEAGKQVFDVNYWGSVRCIQQVLPAMRERAAGHILNVSSVAGRVAAIGQVVYSSAKWAVEALSEGLAQEVGTMGIRVSIIEPGVTRTAILPKNIDTPPGTAYEIAYRRMLQMYAKGIEADVSADVVADTIWEAMTTEQPRLRYPCSWGGHELVEGRARTSDAEWVALGAATDDDEYYDRFEAAFGLDIRP